MIRIVMAEDHTLLRESLSQILSTEEDFKVVGHAEDGREAIALVASLMPDVVVMDIGMSKLNGLEATLRITREFPGVRVIILTQYSMEEYIYRAFNNGACGYLLKKSALKDLVNAIHTVVRGEFYLGSTISKAVVQKLLSLKRNDSDALLFEELSARERETLQLIAEGNSNQEIADLLEISKRTVEVYRTNLLKKLKMNSTAELTHYAIAKGLATLD